RIDLQHEIAPACLAFTHFTILNLARREVHVEFLRAFIEISVTVAQANDATDAELCEVHDVLMRGVCRDDDNIFADVEFGGNVENLFDQRSTGAQAAFPMNDDGVAVFEAIPAGSNWH